MGAVSLVAKPGNEAPDAEEADVRIGLTLTDVRWAGTLADYDGELEGKVTIRLINQATFVPKGSRLTLTLASSSTAQLTSNLLYLDLPMAASARVRIGTAVLKLPVLRTQVTK